MHHTAQPGLHVMTFIPSLEPQLPCVVLLLLLPPSELRTGCARDATYDGGHCRLQALELHVF